MGKKRHAVEAIVAKLREAEVLMAKGQSLIEVVRQLGIRDSTYYKWRKEYGRLLKIYTIKKHMNLNKNNMN
jgi:Transposase.